MHDEQLVAEAALAQRLLQIAEIALDDRLHVGIGGGGAGALVLAELGRDLGGERDGNVRGALGEALADAPLVRGIGVGVQQRDGDGLAARFDHGVDGTIERFGIQRRDHRAVRRDPLDDLGDVPALDERLGFVDVEIVSLVALLPTNDEHVAEAVRSDEADGGTFAFEHRVGGDRGGVQHEANRAGSDAGIAEQLLQPGEHRLAGIARGRYFQRLGGARCAVVQDEIRERPADVEGNTDHAQPASSRWLSSRVRPTRASMSSISASVMINGGAKPMRSPITRSTRPF